MRLFLDTNVILDVLADRQPFADDSAAVLSLLERGAATGFMAAHTATPLFYLLERELGAKRARRALLDLLRLVEVVPVDHDRLLHALALGWRDFEDAVQAACAAKCEAEYLLTRNKRDFAASDVEPLTPSELLAILRASGG
ncbi:MAG: PIN domain-containing protein [Gemmatimonadota bacterium]